MFYDWLNENIEIYEIQNEINNIGETIPNLTKINDAVGKLVSIKTKIENKEGGFEILNSFILYTQENLNEKNIIKYNNEFYKIKNINSIKNHFNEDILFECELEKWKL